MKSEKGFENPTPKKARTKNPFRRFMIIFLIIVLVFLPVSNAIGYEVIFHVLFKDTMRDNAQNEKDEQAFLEENGIVRQEYDIEGSKGHIQGYLYTKEGPHKDLNVNNLIVFSHGIGNGHIAYLPLIGEMLNLDDTMVFAYDATGNGRSDGEATGGLPQGVKDLDAVLNFIKTTPDLNGPSITLVGHSWGAYSAGSVLEFHPEVKRAVLLAGFNASENMLQSYAQRFVGPVVYALLPYVELHEMIKFGRYGNASIVRGCLQTGVEVHIIQALDDERIDPEKYGIRYLEKELEDDPDVHFTELESGGHGLPTAVVYDCLQEIWEE